MNGNDNQGSPDYPWQCSIDDRIFQISIRYDPCSISPLGMRDSIGKQWFCLVDFEFLHNDETLSSFSKIAHDAVGCMCIGVRANAPSTASFRRYLKFPFSMLSSSRLRSLTMSAIIKFLAAWQSSTQKAIAASMSFVANFCVENGWTMTGFHHGSFGSWPQDAAKTLPSMP